MDMNNVWNAGGTGSFIIPFPMNVDAWTVSLTFSSPVDTLTVWNGLNSQCTGNVCTFENQGYNGVQSAGTNLKIDFQMAFASEPSLVGMTVNDIDVCTGGPATTTMEPSTTTNGPETTTTAGPTGPTTSTTA